jgi:hypothetical protein
MDGKSNRPGVRPTTNKLSRFNLVVPQFKAGKVYFPEELKESKIIKEFMSEIGFATVNGIKGKDDCLDTISMLLNLTPWKPSEDTPMKESGSTWGMDDMSNDEDETGISSYIV